METLWEAGEEANYLIKTVNAKEAVVLWSMDSEDERAMWHVILTWR